MQSITKLIKYFVYTDQDSPLKSTSPGFITALTKHQSITQVKYSCDDSYEMWKRSVNLYSNNNKFEY